MRIAPALEGCFEDEIVTLDLGTLLTVWLLTACPCLRRSQLSCFTSLQAGDIIPTVEKRTRPSGAGEVAGSPRLSQDHERISESGAGEGEGWGAVMSGGATPERGGHPGRGPLLAPVPTGHY